MNRKKWYKSKMIWFNVACAIGGAAEASLYIIQDYFDPRAYFGLILVLAGGNMILRMITDSGLEK